MGGWLGVIVTLPVPSRLELNGIQKTFGATQALREVSLSLGPGEAQALIGENGAGKSTLLKILSGVHPADAGSMRLDGKEYRPRDPIAAQRAGVAMIHQELNLAPHLTVAENITLGEEPSRWGWVDRSRQRQLATEALRHLGAEGIPLDAISGELPIAQQQLVEIARALRSKPRVLVLDEPTSSLTRADTEHLFAVLDRLRSEGVSLLYVSHFLEESRRVCSRFTVLRDGASVASGNLPEISNPELIRIMVGREVQDLYPRSARSMGENVFRVQALQGIEKPTDVTFSLRRGEVLGLFGLVGAGPRKRCVPPLGWMLSDRGRFIWETWIFPPDLRGNVGKVDWVFSVRIGRKTGSCWREASRKISSSRDRVILCAGVSGTLPRSIAKLRPG